MSNKISGTRILTGTIAAIIIAIIVMGALAGIRAVFDSAASGKDIPSRAEFQQLLLNASSIEADSLNNQAYLSYISMATEAGCPGPVIYDTASTVRDADWLDDRYGTALTWECTDQHPDADYVFRLTELRESCGPAVYIVNVKDENGNPLSDRAIIRCWPGAPELPYYGPPASRYLCPDDGGVYIGNVGWTSGVGDVGFGVGTGDSYWPETQSGVTNLYVADYDGPSDQLKNLGWLAGTEHCTMFPVFFRIPKEDIITPTPTPPPTVTPGGPTVTPGPTGEMPEGLLRIDEFYIRVEPVGTPEP